MDDGLVCSNSSKAISDIKNYLADHFEITSSEANHFVGLSIFRNQKEKTLYLSQPEYTEKILQHFLTDGCHPVSLPATPGVFLNKEENLKKTIQVPLKEAIGSLMYLMLSSRPDIAFALNQASQFCENPQTAHWATVKKISSYLQGTTNYGLRYGLSLVAPVGYSDSDYAGDINTRQSTSGFIFLQLNSPGAPNSTSGPSISTSVSIFIRAQQQTKETDVKYTPTTEQLADPFTKPLLNPRFSILRKAIGVVPVPDL